MSMLPVGFGASGDYTIEESLRFNASQSSYLSWTPASAGNRKTWTWSGWVKRGGLGGNQTLFEAASGSTYTLFWIYGDKLNLSQDNGAGGVFYPDTNAVLRDTSAWYHIVLAVDTTQATSTDRIKIYINGVLQSITNSYPAQNTDTWINYTYQHRIGYRVANSSPLDGYLSEVNFIDGQALDASSFGEFDATTGVWKPKEYTGTYGTNGFFLDFSDATSATTLGYDYSGQSNNWTLNNFNTTSTSTAYCSMTDTPTPYVDGGNYAVLNPLSPTSYGSLSNSNLTWTGGADWGGSKSTIQIPSTGKWYAEMVVGYTTSNSQQIDFGIQPADITNGYSLTKQYSFGLNSGFFLVINGSYSTNGGFTTAAGSVLQVAVDADAGKIWLGVNNSWYDTYNTTNGNPSGGTNPSGSGLDFTADKFHFFIKTVNQFGNANFGQRPFAYTPPTGFLPLHTGNLPDSNIVDGSKYFDALLWTGDNASSRSITGLEFQPDLVWSKARNVGYDALITDAARGVGKSLTPSSTAGEATNNANGYVSAFNADGFTLTQGSSSIVSVNESGRTYVAWNWKANGTGVSNGAGSITSTVSANPTAGFSIVTYTGTGANATVGHGLGSAPNVVIVKNRDSGTIGGAVYHSSLGATKYLKLFQTTTGTDRDATDNTAWNGGSPTFNGDVFSVGSLNRTNTSTDQMLAYCFAEVSGYSKFGSYTGNGSADGPFVYLGFRPAFLLIKSTGGADWYMWDSARNTYNLVDDMLRPNISAAELNSTTYVFDFLSNGFKIRGGGAEVNTNGNTYIYMAFAENPFKNSLAR